MADEQNKSPKAPPNKIGDGPSWLEQQGAQFQRKTAQDRAERLRYEQAEENQETFEAAIASGIGGRQKEIVESGLSAARKAQNTLGPRIELRAQTKQERFMAQAQSNIRKDFDPSAVNRQVENIARTTFGQDQSLKHISKPYSDIESAYNANMNKIGGLEQGSMALAERLYDVDGKIDPKVAKRLGGKEEQRQAIEKEMAGQAAAMGAQARMGLDPKSQMASLFGAGQHAQDILKKNEYEEDVKKGTGKFGGMSGSELKEAETAAATRLTDALAKLTDGTEKTTEQLEDFKKQAKDAEKDLKDISGIKEAGGGGGSRTAANVAAFAGAAGSAFNIAGNLIQQVGVNQPLSQARNIAGFASIENQKYQMYKGAAGGDIQSQLMLSQWGNAENFGKRVGNNAENAVIARGASGIAQAAAGTARVASDLNPVSDLLNSQGAVNSAIQGGLDVAQGAATSVEASTDLYRRVSRSATQQAGTGEYMNAAKQLTAVQAEQLQGFRDYSVGLGGAAMGMGAAGGGFLARMTDANISDKRAMQSRQGMPQDQTMLEKMTTSRISPEQMAQMAQMGVQNIGSTFNENQIFAARGLERSGYGSKEENMQRMASLASSGANNPQAGLGSVMEAAFSKGLEGSKVLNMMVENTGAMVSQSAGRAAGLDVTGAAATLLTANVNADDPNKEFAAQRAKTVEQLSKDIGTNTGVNFSGMAATARIGKTTGLGGVASIMAQGLDDATLKTVQGMGDEEASKFLLNQGIKVKPNEVKKTMGALIESRQMTLLEAKGAGMAVGINNKEMLNKIKTGGFEGLDESEQEKVSQAGKLAGFSGGKEFVGAIRALDVQNDPNAKKKTDSAMKGEAGSDQLKTIDDMRTQGFKQLSQAAQEATSGFKDAAAALKALGDLAKQVENIGDKGGEKKFKTAAADSAGTFGESVSKFDISVGKFDKAIANMGSRSGLSNLMDEIDTNDKKQGQGHK